MRGMWRPSVAANGAYLYMQVADAVVAEERPRVAIAADFHNLHLWSTRQIGAKRCSRMGRTSGQSGAAQSIRPRTCICSGVHSSNSTDLTNVMCTPIRRCEAEQSRQMNTPYVADAHVGLRAGQSKQV